MRYIFVMLDVLGDSVTLITSSKESSLQIVSYSFVLFFIFLTNTNNNFSSNKIYDTFLTRSTSCLLIAMSGSGAVSHTHHNIPRTYGPKSEQSNKLLTNITDEKHQNAWTNPRATKFGKPCCPTPPISESIKRYTYWCLDSKSRWVGRCASNYVTILWYLYLIKLNLDRVIQFTFTDAEAFADHGPALIMMRNFRPVSTRMGHWKRRRPSNYASFGELIYKSSRSSFKD